MDTSYSELRQNLKKAIDQVSRDHEPIFITSHKKRKAVLLSYEDYCALEETTYLLRSPANARRLLEAVLELETDKNKQKHDLIDDDHHEA